MKSIYFQKTTLTTTLQSDCVSSEEICSEEDLARVGGVSKSSLTKTGAQPLTSPNTQDHVRFSPTVVILGEEKDDLPIIATC
jgi:hypothetical protein